MTFVRSGLTRGMTFVRIGLTRGMTFVRSVLTRGMTFVRSSLTWRMTFVRRGLTRGMTFVRSGLTRGLNFVRSGLTRGMTFVIPSPTKLRGDIVMLPSVHHNPCEHSRINILQWILTKLGTYLVLKRIWNPIDFQGHRSKVKVTGSNFYHITSLWTL